eukprot:gene3693-biopygen2224
MPTELLNVNIASAVLECVRRDAKQRQWSPSTMAKEYAAMAGALRDLPLYTTESRGVYLSEFPEWRAAQKTVKRLERETDTGGPAPITFTQYKKAVADLRRTSPKAALYLSMMWAPSSSSGRYRLAEGQGHHVGDATPPRRDSLAGHRPEIREGTRFRGTYWPASTLAPEEASELRKLKAQRNPKQRLVSAAEDDLIRTQIRTALQRHNRESALLQCARAPFATWPRKGIRGNSDEAHWAQEGRDPLPVHRTWPPNNKGGRSGAGQRCPSPPPAPSSSAPRRHQHSS